MRQNQAKRSLTLTGALLGRLVRLCFRVSFINYCPISPGVVPSVLPSLPGEIHERECGRPTAA